MGRRKILDRLTMDSISAEKAGMSYGKWKALHPHTEVVEVLNADETLCKICGCVIQKRSSTSGRQRRSYCSDLCSYEAVKIRERARYRKKEVIADG